MAIDIKVIPTLRGDEAVRCVMRAEEVMNSNNRVDFCPMRAGISQMLQMTQIFCSSSIMHHDLLVKIG